MFDEINSSHFLRSRLLLNYQAGYFVLPSILLALLSKASANSQ
jgi:hypothetical protein